MFTVEKFCYERHILGVNHMTLDPLSQQEVNRCSSRKDLGFTTSQVLLDYLVGSDEALVFKDTKRDTILGICGAHQSILNRTIVVTPWFFSNGFHKKPKHVRSFLRVAKVLLEEWGSNAVGTTGHSLAPVVTTHETNDYWSTLGSCGPPVFPR